MSALQDESPIVAQGHTILPSPISQPPSYPGGPNSASLRVVTGELSLAGSGTNLGHSGLFVLKKEAGSCPRANPLMCASSGSPFLKALAPRQTSGNVTTASHCHPQPASPPWDSHRCSTAVCEDQDLTKTGCFPCHSLNFRQ